MLLCLNDEDTAVHGIGCWSCDVHCSVMESDLSMSTECDGAPRLMFWCRYCGGY